MSFTSSSKINVDVSYYDIAEQDKFKLYPKSEEIDLLVKNGLTVEMPEFLTYYLFHRKRFEIPGYQNYQMIGKHTETSLKYLEDIFDTNENSIVVKQQLNSVPLDIIERVGESIGLSAINKIHGLIEADWTPIPEQKGRNALKSFDYKISSDGKNLIQVENKGSFAQDNRIITDAIVEHKNNIADKKDQQREIEQFNDLSPTIKYGTITVLDSRPDGSIRCILVDPAAENDVRETIRIKLIKRLQYLLNWISFLSSRSQLASSLATRLLDLIMIKDPFELNNIPLVRGDGEQFNLSPYHPYDIHSRFVATRSKVVDGPAAGNVVQLSTNRLMFIGIREYLLELAERQSFEEILNYHEEIGSIVKKVECVIPKSYYQKMDLPNFIRDSARENNGYIGFELEGMLNYNSSGLVYGILPLR